jgi:predicted PurR-regulated permease PerM
MTTHPDESDVIIGRYSVLALALGLSVVFFLLVRPLLLTLLLAAIFAGMAQPLYSWWLNRLTGRRSTGALATVAVVAAGVIVPVTAFSGIVARQAVQISQSVRPWVQDRVGRSNDPIGQAIDQLPFAERIRPYRAQIEAKVAELAGMAGSWVVARLAAVPRGTAAFLLHVFVLLYAMFFFLRDGHEILRRILYYIPLTPHAEQRLLNHFVSVARATIKGTLVIGGIQGALCGVAFFVAGIPGSAFWAVVMIVLSAIPGIGGALVWVPAVGYLAVTGEVVTAAIWTVWCAIVVGSIDNVLRPALVSREAQMADLMVLVSTLGGLFLFGAAGFIVGPIIAALFVTVWEIYGTVFHDVLPENA